MKTLITLLLSGCCLVASAQKKSHNSLSQSIHDDGKTMTIIINGETGGHHVDYNRTINITGMSAADKNELTRRITDSLGINNPTPPMPQTGPAPSATNTSEVTANDSGNSNISSSIHDDGKTMRVKIKGQRYNKSFNYDRTFNIKGMSAGDKNARLKHITDSLGITKQVQLGTN